MTVLKRFLPLLLSLCLLFCAACTRPEPVVPQNTPVPTPSPEPSPEPTVDPATLPQPDFYTLRLSSDTLPLCWNPHTWESRADQLLWSCTVSPLFDLSVEVTEDGREQAVFLPELAESAEDVTAEFADGERWGIGPEETGRVWRIRLNPDACWNDAARTPITADSYLDSMRALLDPAMQNYRSAPFRSGLAALAGADAYSHSGMEGWEENARDNVLTYPYSEWVFAEDGSCTAADGTELFFSLLQPLHSWLQGRSLNDYYQAGYVPDSVFSALLALADEDGYVPVTAETAELLYSFTGSEDWGRESRERLASYVSFRSSWPEVGWDAVGLLKEDDLTILYICERSVTEFDLLSGLTMPWLVYLPMYEAGKFLSDGRLYTDYGTSAETSMSCGPYRLESVEGTEFTLTRNPDWFGYQDGRHEGQFQTDRIILEVMSDEKAQERFLAGELGALRAEGMAGETSLTEPDGYVYRFFLNTDFDTLVSLQQAEGDSVNKVCLANAAFREALSCAIDRDAFAAVEPGCRSMLSLFGSLSYDTVSDGPLSRYSSSDEAMRTICNAYGTDLSAYPSVREAREACTGYDPARARRLFQLAVKQMTADDSWQDDMTISLRCAVTDGELTDAMLARNALLQSGLEEAVRGTALEGKLTITFCSLENRYDAVADGEIEMGFGAWGSAAFDPYSLLRCYCDPDFARIQEGCGFAPASQLLTILIGEEPVTLTFTEWSLSLTGDGVYASDPSLRRMLLAKLEESLLRERRCIPVFETGSTLLISPRLIPGAAEYDILYGFGGLRTLRYTMDDAQWAGQLSAP